MLIAISYKKYNIRCNLFKKKEERIVPGSNGKGVFFNHDTWSVRAAVRLVFFGWVAQSVTHMDGHMVKLPHVRGGSGSPSDIETHMSDQVNMDEYIESTMSYGKNKWGHG